MEPVPPASFGRPRSQPRGSSNGNNTSSGSSRNGERSSPNEINNRKALSAQHHVHFGNNDNPSSSSSSQDPQSALSHIFGFFTALIACTCICGLVTLLFMLYFTVRPFSVSSYRRLSAQLGLACFLDALALLLPTIRIHLTGDSDVPSPVGTSILVSNHVCDADWWVMFMLGRAVGLQGTMKAMLRNEYLQVNVDATNSNGATANGMSTASANSSSHKNASGSPTTGTGGGSGANNTTPTAAASRLIASAAFHSPNNAHGHANSTSSSSSSNNNHNNHQHSHQPSSTSSAQHPADLSLMARLLHLLLDFPLVNGEDNIADREQLFRLLRSFAHSAGLSNHPVHFLSFPEGWCVHKNMSKTRILQKSNEFAQKESRPQLKHLLLPRTRGFNASLECLREANPVVYDVTLAYEGYNGSLHPSEHLSLTTLWTILRRKTPTDMYVRVKRHSLEEVLQDASWLDKKWQEKDRLLSHFARHGYFPQGAHAGSSSARSRSSQYRHFDTWSHSIEGSLVAMSRLLILPCLVPILCLLSIPIFWALVFIWLMSNIMQRIFPGYDMEQATLSGMYESSSDSNLQSRTPGSNSGGTPFMPATPFASPTAAAWFGGFGKRS